MTDTRHRHRGFFLSGGSPLSEIRGAERLSHERT